MTSLEMEIITSNKLHLHMVLTMSEVLLLLIVLLILDLDALVLHHQDHNALHSLGSLLHSKAR